MGDDSSPTSIIFFALGLIAAAGEDVPRANAAALIAVASELGLGEGACRAAILRLRRDSQIVSERVGRGARYAPAPAIAAAQRRWSAHFTAGPPAWDGRFHGLVYDFPEARRARRDRLRRAAQLAGYGLLHPGLLICPDDRWAQLADDFTDERRAGRILAVTLTLDADADPCAVAARLWGLDALAARYRELAAVTRERLATSTDATDASPVAALYALTNPIYAAVADDPALPAQLLGDDWPAPELGRALRDAGAALGPVAVAHVAELAAAAASPRR